MQVRAHMAVGQDLALQHLPVGRLDSAGGKTTFLGTLSSVSALLAACSCCILPLALAATGASTSLSSAASALGPLRWPLTAFSVAMVTLSWLILIRQRRLARNCPSQRSARTRGVMVIALSAATAITFLALSWSAVEPTVMRILL